MHKLQAAYSARKLDIEGKLPAVAACVTLAEIAALKALVKGFPAAAAVYKQRKAVGDGKARKGDGGIGQTAGEGKLCGIAKALHRKRVAAQQSARCYAGGYLPGEGIGMRKTPGIKEFFVKGAHDGAGAVVVFLFYGKVKILRRSAYAAARPYARYALGQTKLAGKAAHSEIHGTVQAYAGLCKMPAVYIGVKGAQYQGAVCYGAEFAVVGVGHACAQAGYKQPLARDSYALLAAAGIAGGIGKGRGKFAVIVNAAKLEGGRAVVIADAYAGIVVIVIMVGAQLIQHKAGKIRILIKGIAEAVQRTGAIVGAGQVCPEGASLRRRPPFRRNR